MNDTETAGSDGELARLVEALARQAEASRRTAELIESRALPLLERIALALERAPSPAAPAPAPRGTAEDPSHAIAGCRRAIDEGRWDDARAIAQDLGRDHPDEAGVAALGDELDRARQRAVDNLRDRIGAAQRANDPGAVMASRDELAPLLDGEALRESDRSLAKWLIGLIQRRLRTGTIRPDVVDLAGQVADRFGATTEGASLRAALPTLRRSAGLCPRCGGPYTGIEDACPKCLAAALPPPPTPADATAGPIIPADEPEEETQGEPVDLNNDRFWNTP